ncbi:hypothetical protein O9G_005101 [Rozella allomycis CSF55]|uniref:Uncharacterized protein n=1 Tax=Rozella allomycis (strain CSF55) TaxID=988480 RepID=A0A075B3L9_ROZAC|nr:hypothetical protein O9G_005101 [Rozella allomycis CSF55]|eukprot:EPZ35581.1 hypothetical protein O9G_005101 [Rozella allomycis CSF55]
MNKAEFDNEIGHISALKSTMEKLNCFFEKLDNQVNEMLTAVQQTEVNMDQWNHMMKRAAMISKLTGNIENFSPADIEEKIEELNLSNKDNDIPLQENQMNTQKLRDTSAIRKVKSSIKHNGRARLKTRMQRK